MDKRHTAENLSEQLINTFGKWDITNKILAIVTDNAKNITNAIPWISPEIYSVKCAAHSLQLAVNCVLKNENIYSSYNKMML